MRGQIQQAEPAARLHPGHEPGALGRTDGTQREQSGCAQQQRPGNDGLVILQPCPPLPWSGTDLRRLAAALREQVRAAKVQAGPTKLILAPGCSVATYSFPPLIHAVREEAREQKR